MRTCTRWLLPIVLVVAAGGFRLFVVAQPESLLARTPKVPPGVIPGAPAGMRL